MTHRSTTKSKSILAPILAPLLARAAVLLVAYAFVLQTVLAPVAAAATTRLVPTDTVPVVVCAEHAQAQDETQPISPHGHMTICQFCLGCLASAFLTPDTRANGAAIALGVTPIRWQAVPRFVSDRDFLAGNPARGPPVLT